MPQDAHEPLSSKFNPNASRKAHIMSSNKSVMSHGQHPPRTSATPTVPPQSQSSSPSVPHQPPRPLQEPGLQTFMLGYLLPSDIVNTLGKPQKYTGTTEEQGHHATHVEEGEQASESDIATHQTPLVNTPVQDASSPSVVSDGAVIHGQTPSAIDENSEVSCNPIVWKDPLEPGHFVAQENHAAPEQTQQNKHTPGSKLSDNEQRNILSEGTPVDRFKDFPGPGEYGRPVMLHHPYPIGALPLASTKPQPLTAQHVPQNVHSTVITGYTARTAQVPPPSSLCPAISRDPPPDGDEDVFLKLLGPPSHPGAHYVNNQNIFVLINCLPKERRPPLYSLVDFCTRVRAIRGLIDGIIIDYSAIPREVMGKFADDRLLLMDQTRLFKQALDSFAKSIPARALTDPYLRQGETSGNVNNGSLPAPNGTSIHVGDTATTGHTSQTPARVPPPNLPCSLPISGLPPPVLSLQGVSRKPNASALAGSAAVDGQTSAPRVDTKGKRKVVDDDVTTEDVPAGPSNESPRKRTKTNLSSSIYSVSDPEHLFASIGEENNQRLTHNYASSASSAFDITPELSNSGYPPSATESTPMLLYPCEDGEGEYGQMDMDALTLLPKREATDRVLEDLSTDPSHLIRCP
ncbi:hypothetical protein CONPUDRAFT_169640 [Coniophora puteana RWD-64-598 SS2]|uniref:Uncharacterized protein n=1 Tax=Coniophora puteana (strain RWD-64-598) TaxID=741705 RepID=A0A5M3M8T8_CONPW|nr:uncharacterized protein CONPUDRAFT_169640 [Coniophora puteana RWD-64-598 SS2]EIW75254.1 hypothetical protein CONPUDRAFT_169640 [Coniophora puteana RWD-64-598 SS2]